MSDASPDPGAPVVALLRAVNVGGTGKVAMPALREAATALGHRDVATHLATGNLVLVPRAGWSGPVAALEAELAGGLRTALGLPLELVVRTVADVDAVVAANPYPEVAQDDPSRLLVVFLDGPVERDGAADLSRYGRERATWHGREGYVHYPDGIGRSRVTGDVVARLTGRTGTGRSWRTVLAVQALLRERAAR